VLRSPAFTRGHALLEESPLYGVARKTDGCSEVLARDYVPPAAKFKLAERSGAERIAGEAITVGNGVNLFEPALGACELRDRKIEEARRLRQIRRQQAA
jgi:hypothetical protein